MNGPSAGVGFVSLLDCAPYIQNPLPAKSCRCSPLLLENRRGGQPSHRQHVLINELPMAQPLLWRPVHVPRLWQSAEVKQPTPSRRGGSFPCSSNSLGQRNIRLRIVGRRGKALSRWRDSVGCSERHGYVDSLTVTRSNSRLPLTCSICV
jgi:hypothetical protein